LVLLLSNAESDDVTSRLESFSGGLRDLLVLADALGQLGGSEQWVLLLADGLVGGLINGILTVLGQVQE